MTVEVVIGYGQDSTEGKLTAKVLGPEAQAFTLQDGRLVGWIEGNFRQLWTEETKASSYQNPLLGSGVARIFPRGRPTFMGAPR